MVVYPPTEDIEHLSNRKCVACGKQAYIFIHNYAEDFSDIFLCKFDALQLSRKLIEDICDLEGDRHG